MNEVLIAFLILFVSLSAFGLIILILNADKKLLELNEKVEKIKTTDFAQFKKVISVLNKINLHIRFDKVKYMIEVGLTTLSAVNLGLLIGKLIKKRRA